MQTTGGSACDVLVVGAGVAGLSAAVELSAAGMDVLVVEARERTGGRLRSVAAGAAGQPLDLGATWFWPHERLVREQVARLGLAVFAQHISGDALYEAPAAGHGVPRSRRIGGNPIDVAAFRFTHGAQSLTDALAAQLPAAALWLNTPVTALRATDAGVAVSAGSQELRARQVILAVPPALAAAAITISPALPRSLACLARATPIWMADTVKVVARYDTPFWRARGLAGAAISHVGPLREIHDMSGLDGSPAALFGFAVGATAASIARRRLQDSSLQQLTRLFGPEAADPVEVHVQNWGTERFTCPPGRPLTTDYTLFGHPGYQEPMLGCRLHWAATETATSNAGHVDGALQAAARAASAVLSRRHLAPTPC